MSQDPWKKAYRMSKSAGGAKGKAAPGRLQRQTSIPLVIALLVLLPLAVGVAMFWFAWQNRGTLLPEYADELPQEIVNRIDIPPRQVDVLLIDEGLGIGLAVFGSQGEVLRNTREWGIEWSLTTLGAERFRLETEGLVITAAGDVIEGYVLELDSVYQNALWEPWFADLRRANVEQQLNLREVQGDADLLPGRTILELKGPKRVQYAGNWRQPAYELEFRDGWLEELRAGMAIGPATEAGDSEPDG